MDESALLTIGRPQGIDFTWGFIEFKIVGVSPYGRVDLFLVMPESLPAEAQYWQREDDDIYRQVEMDFSNGPEIIKLSLADEDGDGVIQNLGAVGVPSGSQVSQIAAMESGTASLYKSRGSGGSSGCSIHRSGPSKGIDLAGFLILVVPFLCRYRLFLRQKNWFSTGLCG